jgi:hypothetical protein
MMKTITIELTIPQAVDTMHAVNAMIDDISKFGSGSQSTECRVLREVHLLLSDAIDVHSRYTRDDA